MKNVFLACTFAFLWTVLVSAGCKHEMGKLSGKVQYRGLPCQVGQPDYNVPPCSGFYPNYEVQVYLEGQMDKPVLTVKSAEDGGYFADLPVGAYVIRTQNGPQAKHQSENKFKITAGETTEVNLTVSTSIL
jgi:hypothetical protein